MTPPRALTREKFEQITEGSDIGPLPGFHEPKEWWMTSNYLGVVILDKIDNDWSCVALAQRADGKWQGYKLSVSLPTMDDARVALFEAFEIGLASRKK